MAEERERSKAELAKKIEKIQAETDLKKAAVDFAIEREELQGEHSDNVSTSES